LERPSCGTSWHHPLAVEPPDDNGPCNRLDPFVDVGVDVDVVVDVDVYVDGVR